MGVPFFKRLLARGMLCSESEYETLFRNIASMIARFPAVGTCFSLSASISLTRTWAGDARILRPA
jgi:hypothetical protein